VLKAGQVAIGVVAALWLVGCAASGPIKPMDFDSMIEDMEKKAEFIRQFRADFSKTRHTAVFNREVSVRGRLIFQKPNKFALTLTGDINVEMLSDGRTIHLIHDNKDQEVFQVEGDRDLSRFADPLMVLIHSIGQGGLRKFQPSKSESREAALTTEFHPRNDTNFERIQSVTVQFSEQGTIKKVVILSRDGERDEVVFESWRMLAQDDPEIRRLNERLKTLSESATGLAEPSGPDAVTLVRDSQRIKEESFVRAQ